MADTSYEFAIFGSTPLAGLLAGLLGTVHRKRVCLISEARSAFRLPQGVDLSVMPVTRPETWVLLKESTAETLKLLRQMRGPSGVQRVDPIFAADGSEGSEALSHMRHMAAGFGYAVERLPEGGGLVEGGAYRIRDAVLLRRSETEPTISAWLTASGVGQLANRDVGVTLRRDGSARMAFAGTTITAAHAVLADDAAILGYLEAAERDRTLALETSTAMLTEPAGALASPVIIYVDRGVTLTRNRRGGILALGAGPPERALIEVGRCLEGHGPLRRAGQRILRRVTTVDGGPLVGPARGLKATIIAGFGISGAFLAPALARQIAGTASDREKSYFSAREAGRGNARANVADFGDREAIEVQI